MTILFASAELFPFSKSGGLADMASALPRALNRKGQEVTAVTPLYAFIDRKKYNILKTEESFRLKIGGMVHDVEIHRCKYEGVEILFVYNEILCNRQHLYGPPGGSYPDNDLRFAIFCHALLGLLHRENYALCHLNDWHTALAALLAKEEGVQSPIVYTIHNLAYQGIFPPSSLERCGIDARHFTPEEIEFYGQVNWMKAGIGFADAVTTVSPTYAREILTPEFGCGLDGYLRRHSAKLRGILNGIDPTLYDPGSDPSLPAHFDAENFAGKAECKAALCRDFELDDLARPLVVFIGRFVAQKGMEWIIEALDALAALPANFIFLGEGEERYHAALEAAAGRTANLRCFFGYDEALSHRLYAGADLLLMPSRFEPCGLNQIIAMRYGTIPVVHAVGGLRDTVHPVGSGRCGEGFPFEDGNACGLVAAIEKALTLTADPQKLEALRRFDMGCDFSIGRCAEEYRQLYGELLSGSPSSKGEL